MLAIAGGKGGTGKTTTALALARAFASDAPGTTRGEAGTSRDEVLVVDADVDMPDVHAMTSVARTPTVLDRERGTPVPDLAGVRVAPAPPPDASSRFHETLARLRDASRARSEAASVRDRGPSPVRVLVDSPCGAGPDAALPLSVADGVVLVTRPTPAAVRDTAKTAAMARALDTPVVAAAVIAPRGVDDERVRSLAGVLGVRATVHVPFVDGDPFDSRTHRAAVTRLGREIHGRQTPF